MAEEGYAQVNGDKGSVELVNVTKKFGDFTAVDSLNLQVQPGEFLSLLGPSGCGKTTTLRMLAGFEEPTAGDLFISGEPVNGSPPFKRDVNTVFQAYALFPHMSVAENVAYGLRQKKASKSDINAKVSEALDMVKMRSMAGRKPNQLSGGQQQRVAVARALVNRPSLLLLDEPLGALDRKLREAMQTELKQLQRQLNISFVFVTHDQDEALAMSDRVVVMNAGRIEQIGAPREVSENPETRFIAEFVGVTNVIEGVVTSGGNGHALVEAAGGRVSIDERLVAGQRVSLAVRPEKIRFVGEGVDGAIAGTVEEALYLGDVTHWRVRLDGGEAWTIFERNDGSEVDLSPGRRVGLVWDPEHTIHLER